MNDNLIITIGRQFGSGGREIGKRLADLFGIAYYDKELINEASKSSGLSTEYFEKADERAPSALLNSFSITGSQEQEEYGATEAYRTNTFSNFNPTSFVI